jgi:uncharacterized protein YraI
VNGPVDQEAMMRRQLIQSVCVCAGFAGLLALPAAAVAQQSAAYTSRPVNLRAGPARDYPVVAQLAPGTPVTVMGCISDYSWCDIALPNLRGWAWAGNLSYAWQGNNVPLLSYGTTIGLPIVTFSIGSYWNNYYRGRPWYRDRGRWEHHPQPRPQPRPTHGPMRPPGNSGHFGNRPGNGPQMGHGGGRPPGNPGHPGNQSHGGGGNHGGGHGGGGHGGGGGGHEHR